MRMLVLSAAIAATVMGALPASAEVVLRAGDAAVVVGHEHDRDWRRHHAECRDVRVRARMPDGRVVVRVRHTC